jgi:hypothetical protein
VLTLNRIPVWSRGPRERIVIPGFRDLRSFSIAYEGLLKENLGNWVASYFRIGNFRMAMGHPRAGQAKVARWLIDSLEKGRLPAVYLSRFPHMNHVVIPIGCDARPAATCSSPSTIQLPHRTDHPALRRRAPQLRFREALVFPRRPGQRHAHLRLAAALKGDVDEFNNRKREESTHSRRRYQRGKRRSNSRCEPIQNQSHVSSS